MNFKLILPRARETFAELSAAHDDLTTADADSNLTAWFDYRNLGAGDRAVLMLAAYDKHARRYQSTNIDALTAYACPYRDDVFDGMKRALAIHRLRAMIDGVGCPYLFAMSRLFKRMAEIGLPHMPLVQELGMGNAADYLREHWQTHIADQLIIPDSKLFQADNYRADPIQDAYLTFATAQLKRRPYPYMGLASLMFRHRVMPESWAVDRFGHDAVSRAKAHWEGLQASLHPAPAE